MPTPFAKRRILLRGKEGVLGGGAEIVSRGKIGVGVTDEFMGWFSNSYCSYSKLLPDVEGEFYRSG